MTASTSRLACDEPVADEFSMPLSIAAGSALPLGDVYKRQELPGLACGPATGEVPMLPPAANEPVLSGECVPAPASLDCRPMLPQTPIICARTCARSNLDPRAAASSNAPSPSRALESATALRADLSNFKGEACRAPAKIASSSSASSLDNGASSERTVN